MKMLKSGNKDKLLWVGRCDVCGAIFEAHLSELGVIAHGDYRNNNEDYIWTECKECGTTNGICMHMRSGQTGRQLLIDNGLPAL